MEQENERSSDTIYHSNAVHILQSDRCFKFLFENRELSILMMDDEFYPPEFRSLSLEETEKWTKYVQDLTETQKSLDTDYVKQHHVFLLRYSLKVFNS